MTACTAPWDAFQPSAAARRRPATAVVALMLVIAVLATVVWRVHGSPGAVHRQPAAAAPAAGDAPDRTVPDVTADASLPRDYQAMAAAPTTIAPKAAPAAVLKALAAAGAGAAGEQLTEQPIGQPAEPPAAQPAGRSAEATAVAAASPVAGAEGGWARATPAAGTGGPPPTNAGWGSAGAVWAHSLPPPSSAVVVAAAAAAPPSAPAPIVAPVTAAGVPAPALQPVQPAPVARTAQPVIGWPATGPITSLFGPAHPLGIDIGVPAGTPLYAAATGRVSFVGGDPCCSYGYYVDIDHGGGVTTRYGHMIQPSFLRPGDLVRTGDPIGYAGSTGNSTGPHLHFEIRLYGVPVNPLLVLP